jgi:hypothetical protein
MKAKHPYAKINPTVLKVLSYQSFAEITIQSWLYSKGVRAKSVLASQPLETGVSYVNDEETQFAKLLRLGKFVSMKNAVLWTGEQHATLYNRVTRNRAFLEELGMTYANEADNSLRLYACSALGLHQHVNMTSYLTLFSPCCVAWFLLTGSTDHCKSFREFISDWGASKPYSSGKLYLTYIEKKNEKQSQITR